MRRMKPPTWWLALAVLWAGSANARPDVIFHVPEVLVRHAAVPRARPVGTGPTGNTSRGNDTEVWPAAAASDTDHDLVQERFEYYVEHEISAGDAKKAAHIMRLGEVAETLPGCGRCSKREMEYCERNVLGDHCCCERRFLPEPFPWIPHTCYIGPERCTPVAQNCAHYARLRDCCCYRKLAERWKGILSRGSQLSVSGMALLVFSVILFTLYL